MNILHISDIHYRAQYQGGNFYEDMLQNMSSPLIRMKELITSIMNEYSIQVICVTGDLCDNGTKEDYEVLKDYFDSINVPVFIVLGNHDNKVCFNQIYKNLDTDEPYLEVNQLNGYKFISFDNSKFEYSNGYMDEDRLDWLQQNLDNQSIVLMHHQFEDVPGIPKMENSEGLKKVLLDKNPICILNGHTHWCKKTFLENIPIFTAPSVSFHAINEEDGAVIFSESLGFNLYSLDDNKIELIENKEQESKELAIYQPKI